MILITISVLLLILAMLTAKNNKKIKEIPYITKENIENINLENSILLFYRQTCPDCRIVKKDLINKFKDKEDVYLVDTTTKIGKKLVSKYEIISVPRALLVGNNKNNKNINYKLYIKKTNSFDEKLADEILKEQKNRKK